MVFALSHSRVKPSHLNTEQGEKVNGVLQHVVARRSVLPLNLNKGENV